MRTKSISERSDMHHLLNYIINNHDTGIRDHSVSPEKQYENELAKLSDFLYQKYGEDMQEEIWEDISELIYACRELFSKWDLEKASNLKGK